MTSKTLYLLNAVRYKDLLDNTYNDISNLIETSGNVCTIIYCLERSTCDDLSGYLSKNGISSAGMLRQSDNVYY